MTSRLVTIALHGIVLLGVSAFLLVPTGMCICDGHDDSDAEQHEPGCPKVRKLERSDPPATYTACDAACDFEKIGDETLPAGPIEAVARTAHGPPRGRPLFITLHSLLI